MQCSIIIPTKNRPAGLKKAVASALAALPEDGEVLVIDDDSTPRAQKTLEGVMEKSLRIIVNPGPHGPSEARNFGVTHATGRTIFFLDDDDELLPHYCKGVIKKRQTLPQNCVYGHCAPLHNKGDKVPEYHGRNQKTGIYDEQSTLASRLAGLGMGFWIDRAVFQKIGGIDPNIHVNEDTELSIRLASAGLSSFYDAEAGVLLSLDGDRPAGDQSSITRSAQAAERARGFEYILTRHQEYLLLHPSFRRLFLSRAVKYRSRAQNRVGWGEFCKTIIPATDRALFSTLGTGWLHMSIALRKLRHRR